MKRILLGVLLASTAMSAQAADLAPRPYTKAPPMAPVYDWTGLYLGVNAGLGVGRNRAVHDLGPLAISTHLQPLGAVGGGQIGYNWQTNSFFGPIVFGVEADLQGADMTDNRTNFIGALQYNQRLNWFGTARGRVGLVNGPMMTYLTGGWAYGNVGTTVIQGGVPSAFGGGRSGWTWGSGVEAALGGNWTGKIEYLYLDLGNRTDFIGGQALHSELRENIFRAGLNYRIGGHSPYVPMVTANWNGLYLGGNFGGGVGRNRTTISNPAGNLAQFNLAPNGFVGGGQIGYNWQAGNIVFGLETDFQGSTLEDNKACFFCVPGASVDFNSKLQWFGTVRGRLGYAVGNSMFYATGGFAYGNVQTALNTPLNNFSFSNTRTGYAVGGGIETPLPLVNLFGGPLFGPNWTSTTEYLYVDLGRSSFNIGGGPNVLTTGAQEHIFRTGLNYHFNMPTVAHY
ncbi:outer membrane beta-barrel protein [Nitrobacter sp.]|uniref:outer membrane protein n=1 Tax=Nitrobacter sp. TaxID=29420 RepID=UPI001D3A8D67|nr:outer membrane beta-barrel protein [Nitrobacter sp.]MCB1392936.1 porin family protein [Nitrobacter sp.]